MMEAQIEEGNAGGAAEELFTLSHGEMRTRRLKWRSQTESIETPNVSLVGPACLRGLVFEGEAGQGCLPCQYREAVH